MDIIKKNHSTEPELSMSSSQSQKDYKNIFKESLKESTSRGDNLSSDPQIVQNPIHSSSDPLYNKSLMKESVNKVNNDIFNKMVTDYIKNNKPHICILTPCYGGVTYVNYVFCLIETIKFLQSIDVKLTIEFCKNDSLVSRARNNLIAKAMYNPEITHMMFIDNDITWSPIDIVKLMVSDKSVIGGLYPLKKYNWERILKDQNVIKSVIEKKNNSQFKDIISDVNMIQHYLLNYNANFLENNLNIKDNLTKVRHIATGFMMIKRNTIEQMCKAFPSTKYTDDVGFLEANENKYAYALFDCGVEEDHYFSEDWLFCHRWSKLSGNIYLDVSINLKHTGVEDYNGSFIASLIAN